MSATMRDLALNYYALPRFIVAPEDLVISKLDWARNTRSETQLGDAGPSAVRTSVTRATSATPTRPPVKRQAGRRGPFYNSGEARVGSTTRCTRRRAPWFEHPSSRAHHDLSQAVDAPALDKILVALDGKGVVTS